MLSSVCVCVLVHHATSKGCPVTAVRKGSVVWLYVHASVCTMTDKQCNSSLYMCQWYYDTSPSIPTTRARTHTHTHTQSGLFCCSPEGQRYIRQACSVLLLLPPFKQTGLSSLVIRHRRRSQGKKSLRRDQ